MLKTKPDMLRSIGIHETNGFMTKVELVRGSIVIPGLAQYKNVVAATERIRVDSSGAKVNIRVVAWSLASGRPVEIPFRELFVALNWSIESLVKLVSVSSTRKFGESQDVHRFATDRPCPS